MLDQAVGLRPAELRSLEAIHLATARVVSDEIGVLVTCDQRLAEAASGYGLTVASPS